LSHRRAEPRLMADPLGHTAHALGLSASMKTKSKGATRSARNCARVSSAGPTCSSMRSAKCNGPTPEKGGPRDVRPRGEPCSERKLIGRGVQQLGRSAAHPAKSPGWMPETITKPITPRRSGTVPTFRRALDSCPWSGSCRPP
jgi:hypothetical protein